MPFDQARFLPLAALIVGFMLASGCAVDPGSGQRGPMLLTTEDEIAYGEERFPHEQQTSGGLYKVDPAVARYVASVGARVAAVSDRALPYEFVVVNDGTPNAWSLPGGKVGIHRGLLLELENEAELAAVLGHELVHAARKHWSGQIQGGVQSELGDSDVAALADDLNPAAVQQALGVANLNYGRNAERESDYYGMKYLHAAGYDTAAAVTVQEKFVDLSDRRQSRWLRRFRSHPPSHERLANNRAALIEFPPGGELGTARYQAHMATLLRDREAYDLAEQAQRNAMNDPVAAARLIDEAISQQPREALFHSIGGDILASLGHHADAVLAYGKAIERDPDYFGYYVRRGLAHERLGEQRLARDDLARSNGLLPTPFASYRLGTYALADGERAEAKRQFEVAGRSRGGLGAAARAAYVSLDLEDAPWKYVRAGLGTDTGQIVLRIVNMSDFPVADIVVRVEMEVDGITSYRQMRLNHLDPGTYDDLETGIYRGIGSLGPDWVTVARAQIVGAAPGW